MSIAIALWSKVVEAGEPIEFTPRADVHITNVALSADLADESGRTTLKLVYFGPGAEDSGDDEEEDEEDEEKEQNAEPIGTVLCSLTPGKIEHAKVDLILEAGQTYLFDTVGKNTVYISGNYIEQTPSDLPPNPDEIMSDEEDEEAFRLEDVSSDVEVDVDELMDDDDDDEKVLEPSSPPKKKVAFTPSSIQQSKKRSREEDAEPEQAQPSKKQLKKLNKKQKTEGGDAVPAGLPAETKKPAKEAKKPEQQKPADQKKGGEGQQDGEGKKKKDRKRKDKSEKSKA